LAFDESAGYGMPVERAGRLETRSVGWVLEVVLFGGGEDGGRESCGGGADTGLGGREGEVYWHFGGREWGGLICSCRCYVDRLPVVWRQL
jgi:hypothetical protein